MKLIAKKHYTFTELAERWSCTANELMQAVIDGDLVASFHISAGSYVLNQFTLERCHNGSVCIPTELHDFSDDDGGKAARQQVDGFYYLIYPRRTGASSCEFGYFSSKPVDHEQGDTCFSFEKNVYIDEVFGTGVVMVQEVARVEAKNEDKPEPKNREKSLSRRERDGLLRIIGGLLVLLQDQRPVKAETSNQSAIIKALVDSYGDKDGISQRNLEGKFADAKRELAQP